MPQMIRLSMVNDPQYVVEVLPTTLACVVDAEHYQRTGEVKLTSEEMSVSCIKPLTVIEVDTGHEDANGIGTKSIMQICREEPAS